MSNAAVMSATTKFRLREFRREASRDSLTDLAKRRLLLKALKAVTAMPSSAEPKHAFFVVDLNDFKRVNDLHGHALGHRVLQVIAQRFRAVCRPSDLLAQLGGDEFALLCYDVVRDTALAIVRRLLASLEGEIRLGGHSYRIGASIGAALIPDDGEKAEEIIITPISRCIAPRAKIVLRSYSLNQTRRIGSKYPPTKLEGLIAGPGSQR